MAFWEIDICFWVGSIEVECYQQNSVLIDSAQQTEIKGTALTLAEAQQNTANSFFCMRVPCNTFQPWDWTKGREKKNCFQLTHTHVKWRAEMCVNESSTWNCVGLNCNLDWSYWTEIYWKNTIFVLSNIQSQHIFFHEDTRGMDTGLIWHLCEATKAFKSLEMDKRCKYWI